MRKDFNTSRYLGLELSGAKSNKTTLASIEYYPKEKKVFLLDTYDRVAFDRENESGPTTGDEALLALLSELVQGVAKIGVNVPLDLPPCTTCIKKSNRGIGIVWLVSRITIAIKFKCNYILVISQATVRDFTANNMCCHTL